MKTLEQNLRERESNFLPPRTEKATALLLATLLAEVERSAPSGESAGAGGDEDGFFDVDTSVPAITGRVRFIDTIPACAEVPSSSRVGYHLNANKVT